MSTLQLIASITVYDAPSQTELKTTNF